MIPPICTSCKGSGFTMEGEGDCGGPNFCPECAGEGVEQTKSPFPTRTLMIVLLLSGALIGLAVAL